MTTYLINNKKELIFTFYCTDSVVKPEKCCIVFLDILQNNHFTALNTVGIIILYALY